MDYYDEESKNNEPAETEEDFNEDMMDEIEEVTDVEIRDADKMMEELAKCDSESYFFASAKKLPLLTREEEIELGKRIAAGDLEARNKLIEHNIRLVVSIAKRYIDRGYDFIDLVQEGTIGLITAADKYDYTLGYKFSTYATYWIMQILNKMTADRFNFIHVPYKVANQYHKTTYELSQRDNHESLKTEEVAEKMNSTPKRVAGLYNIFRTPVNLDSRVNEDDDSVTYSETIASNGEMPVEEEMQNEEISRIVEERSKYLDLSERTIIFLYNGFADGKNHTYEEIGNEFNLSRERVRQIIERGKAKLRIVVPEDIIDTAYAY